MVRFFFQGGTWTHGSHHIVLLLLSPGRAPTRAKHTLKAFPPSHISPTPSSQTSEAVILNSFCPAHRGNVIMLAFMCMDVLLLLAVGYTWELKGAG